MSDKPSNSPLPAPRGVRHELAEYRLTPVAGVVDGTCRGIDLRLYRSASGGSAAPTPAGFRLPLAVLRRLAAELVAMADATGAP